MPSIQSAIVFMSAMFVSWPVFAADTASQPLNRADCDKAGMHWDENANVCASAQAGSPQVSMPKTETSAKSTAAATSPKKMTKSPHKKQVSAKKSSSRAYKKQATPAAAKPATHRPFRWLFPNASKRAGKDRKSSVMP
jgi:hypothetical protein